jgi:hypothetical protein
MQAVVQKSFKTVKIKAFCIVNFVYSIKQCLDKLMIFMHVWGISKSLLKASGAEKSVKIYFSSKCIPKFLCVFFLSRTPHHQRSRYKIQKLFHRSFIKNLKDLERVEEK